ncbi:MAG: VCBS repeat-containing protein, partial [Bryobacteraceae bacterium]
DFNGDGKPDLAITNHKGNNVTVLLGNGKGGFTATPGSPFPAGSFLHSVAVGDFNGDGKPDLATANDKDTVTVLLGNGTGGFTEAPGSPFRGGSGPFSVAVGDFDGDGKPDLAIANIGSGTVTVLLNRYSGPATPTPAKPRLTPLAPGP